MPEPVDPLAPVALLLVPPPMLEPVAAPVVSLPLFMPLPDVVPLFIAPLLDPAALLPPTLFAELLRQRE